MLEGMHHHLLTSLLLAGLLAPPALPASESQPVDGALRLRLARALADNGSFPDRFEAQVWLTDMSARLAKKIPNENKRLDLLKLIHHEAKRNELPPELVLAVIEVESDFERFAISRAGAQGLMQIMPFWLKELNRPNDNLFNIQTNLRMGCTILRYYLDMEKENLHRALARYNGSLGSHKYPQRVFSALRQRWYR